MHNARLYWGRPWLAYIVAAVVVVAAVVITMALLHVGLFQVHHHASGFYVKRGHPILAWFLKRLPLRIA